MPLSIVDIMNFTNYFSVLSQKIKKTLQISEAFFLVHFGKYISQKLDACFVNFML